VPTSKDDHPKLESLEQEPLISMHGVLKDYEVAGLLKVESLNVQNLPQIDPLELPQNNIILLSGNDTNTSMDIPKTSQKPSQAKKKSTILLGNFLKRITRIEGHVEDVTKNLVDYGGPKGSHKTKEVVRLFVGSFSKARSNPIFEAMSKKHTRQSK
jgi:hypothetical protein